jgi:multicomponent Na+:H+ antiporter subunit B
MRSLFGIVMLQGVYSLVCAAWFVNLDAVDVAFTEAAVGAGVSTVLMLSAMLLADRKSAPVPRSRQWAPLLVCVFAGAAMFYAIGDMPGYGDAYSPANSYVGIDYMAKTAEEIKIPNVVTAVLGSYRGYDTFGEAVVIFSAGLGVLLLLGLNGNAGRWVAKVQGQRISDGAAPAAQIKREAPADSALTEVAPIVQKAAPVKTPAAKKASPKKPPLKKTTPKSAAAKNPTVKKAAVKKTVAKKTVAKKTTAKASPARKAIAKKTATKKAAAKKPASKKPAAKKAAIKAPAKRRGRPPKAVAAKSTVKKTSAKTSTKTATAKKTASKTVKKPATKKTAKPKSGGKA